MLNLLADKIRFYLDKHLETQGIKPTEKDKIREVRSLLIEALGDIDQYSDFSKLQKSIKILSGILGIKDELGKSYEK